MSQFNGLMAKFNDLKSESNFNDSWEPFKGWGEYEKLGKWQSEVEVKYWYLTTDVDWELIKGIYRKGWKIRKLIIRLISEYTESLLEVDTGKEEKFEAQSKKLISGVHWTIAHRAYWGWGLASIIIIIIILIKSTLIFFQIKNRNLVKQDMFSPNCIEGIWNLILCLHNMLGI